jgi:hypothetical protein
MQFTEKHEQFFDDTIDKLEDLVRCADAARQALIDGEFDTAVSAFDEGSCLADSGNVWGAVLGQIETIRDWVEDDEAGEEG